MLLKIVQKYENTMKALEFIKSKVQITNIGVEVFIKINQKDIVQGNSKLIIGLVWSIILRFTISNITEEGKTAKEGFYINNINNIIIIIRITTMGSKKNFILFKRLSSCRFYSFMANWITILCTYSQTSTRFT